MRFKPHVSLMQVTICAGIAIVASGATLLSSIIPAASACSVIGDRCDCKQ